MKVGICCAGIGAASTGDFIRRCARAAERAGFSSFWMPDHVVIFSEYRESRYSYFEIGGEYPFPAPDAPLVDPVMAMAWAAAATEKLEVGSDVVILPQRNPLVFAKQLASLDEFSGGRVALGVGVGWAKEEYEAVGADWAHRGKRMDEYIAVLRTLWRDKVSHFQGDTVSFKDAYMYPKPRRAGGVPILIGGESEAALKRVARAGDGWFPYDLSPGTAAERIAHVKRLTREHGRDPAMLRLFAPIFDTSTMDDLKRLRGAGVTEFYLVMTGKMPLADPELSVRMAELGHQFVDAVADW